MSMHQVEYFIEEAVRFIASSSLSLNQKRSMIFTIFEMETYGDCGFTNLRTIDEMVDCKYTTLHTLEEMYDYKEHHEYYENEYYNGPDGVYYDSEQEKYCVDSGSKAWEIMVAKGIITGEAAEPVELLPFIDVFKVLAPMLDDADAYLKDGFHCTLFLTEAFDDMTDEDCIEMFGMTKEEFEDELENEPDKPEINEKENSFPPKKTAEFLGTTVEFIPDMYFNFASESELYGYKSEEGAKINIFDTEMPFAVEIKPFLQPYKFNVMKIMKEHGYFDMQDAIDHIYHNAIDDNLFKGLVANLQMYLYNFSQNDEVLPSAEYGYKIKHKFIKPNVNYSPTSIRAVIKFTGDNLLSSETYVTMSRENGQSFEVYNGITFGFIDGAEMNKNSEYITNISMEEYSFSGTTRFDLFNSEIPVSIDLDSVNFNYADSCVWALNHLSEEIIDKLCEYSIIYCEDFCDAIGEAPPKIENKRDVLKYINNPCLIVKIPNNNSIVVHLSFDCDWEEEHVLEWLIRDGKILYVGAYSDEPEHAEDEYYNNSWNYMNLKE